MIDLLADRETSVAVVGATDNPVKFGYQIFRDLKHHGYRVWPVNPNRLTVDGDPAYPNLAALPHRPDIINMVVPAQVGLRVAEEAVGLGYRNIWLQPGAASPKLLELLKTADADYLAEACIMVLHRLVTSEVEGA